MPQGGTPPAPPAPRRPKPALPPTPVQEDIYEDTVDSSNLPPPPEELENYEAFEPQDPEPAPAPTPAPAAAPAPAPAPVPPGVPVRPPKRKKSQRSSDAEQAVERKWYFENVQSSCPRAVVFFFYIYGTVSPRE